MLYCHLLPHLQLPLIEKELSSDLNQIPVYSEGVVEWLPVDSEVDDPTRTAAQYDKSMINYDLKTSGGDSDTDNTDYSIQLEPSNNGTYCILT
jgi:hypothetical protein